MEQLDSRTQTPITPEEEALKRNTDCVYFLASPLTCKKGSECEYRHSDIARVNPRDCWFWLNGNCLNPKCGFRHPPLDGLLGATPAVHSLPPSQTTAVAVATQGPNVPGTQAVPCIFFQQGYCLKGDKCPFMHAPYFLNNKTTHSAAANLVPESQPNKKTFGGLGKHTPGQNVSQTNAPKSADLPLQVKSVTKVEKAPSRMEVSGNRNLSTATGFNDEHLRYRPANVHPPTNANGASRSNLNNQVYMLDDQSTPNNKDADEFSRELSPGFDVLVDDELRDSEYYPNEDQFGKTRGHEGNTPNEYDVGRAADYNSIHDFDRDAYRGSRNYDSLEHLQGHYGWDEHRASSERMLGGSTHVERRRYPRADNPGRIAESDLRHHLSKQKMGNGLRSVINRDYARENHADDRSYRAPRKDHLPVHENLVSSRLRGRIKIPGRSVSPIDKNDARPEREIDRARHRGRLSPERALGRPRDKLKGRVEENFDVEERNFRGSRIRRNITDDDNTEFSGPKSLSEIKVGKTSKSYEQHMNDRHSLGKRKYPKTEGVQQFEGDISFEGPKPLSEILKRKRGGEVAFDENASRNEENNQEGKQSFTIPTETKESKDIFSSAADTDVTQSRINKGKSALAAGEIGVAEDKNKPHEGQSSIQRNASELHNEEGMIGDEAYDNRGGESDYEQADGEDYSLYEGANAEDDYFVEDDDADDFAKKMGVMYS